MTVLLKPHTVDVAVADRAARQQTAVTEGSVRQQLSWARRSWPASSPATA